MISPIFFFFSLFSLLIIVIITITTIIITMPFSLLHTMSVLAQCKREMKQTSLNIRVTDCLFFFVAFFKVFFSSFFFPFVVRVALLASASRECRSTVWRQGQLLDVL